MILTGQKYVGRTVAPLCDPHVLGQICLLNEPRRTHLALVLLYNSARPMRGVQTTY